MKERAQCCKIAFSEGARGTLIQIKESVDKMESLLEVKILLEAYLGVADVIVEQIKNGKQG